MLRRYDSHKTSIQVRTKSYLSSKELDRLKAMEIPPRLFKWSETTNGSAIICTWGAAAYVHLEDIIHGIVGLCVSFEFLSKVS